MKILALNSGSSSIKYKVFDANKNFHELHKGTLEKVEQDLSGYKNAMHSLLQEIQGDKIDAVGHRIVHGGDSLSHSVIIDEKVLEEIKQVAKFAPLHSVSNILGIEVVQDLLPGVAQVAVFDTAAHKSMEPKAFLYGIPIDYYEKYKIRKYGFHGINHQYVAHEAARLLSIPLNELKVITCHLGSGCSISAFKNGKNIDNSMGMTPLEGLMMGTRCGDLDPSVVLFLIENIGVQASQVTQILNKKSGLLGLCGKNDMRDIHTMADKGDAKAQVALDVFVYRIQKYIGAFIAALNGVDALVFSGGIGENSASMRARIVENFGYINLQIDQTKNMKHASLFSSNDSDVALLMIPANEELVIAQETEQVLQRSK